MQINCTTFHFRIILFNYLADELNASDKSCPLVAAMCISMPWNLLKTSDALENPLDYYLFNNRIAQGLCRVVQRNSDVLSKKYDVPLVLKVGNRSVKGNA